jgi:hypothetical protein
MNSILQYVLFVPKNIALGAGKIPYAMRKDNRVSALKPTAVLERLARNQTSHSGELC